MASNSTMSPAWAIYCERLGGWLVDTSFVWSWDVAECQEFATEREATKACADMQDNGHDAIQYRRPWIAGEWDVYIIRIR